MKEIHFQVPPDCNLAFAEQWIETACDRQRLDLAMKGTLASYPGSTHWHFRKPGQKGTLELTLYIPDRRIWEKFRMAGRLGGLTPRCRLFEKRSSSSCAPNQKPVLNYKEPSPKFHAATPTARDAIRCAARAWGRWWRRAMPARGRRSARPTRESGMTPST